jgi:predicted HicB family RNase H-like nuclease
VKAKAGYHLFAARVPVALHRALKIEAAKRGVTVASLVELALRQFLKAKRGGP